MAKKCSVCKCNKTKTRAKHWRGDKCNPCYAKKQRKKKVTKDVGRPRKITTGRQFGTTLEASTAYLFAGITIKMGKTRTELLNEMINATADQVITDAEEIITREDLIEAGRNLVNRIIEEEDLPDDDDEVIEGAA